MWFVSHAMHILVRLFILVPSTSPSVTVVLVQDLMPQLDTCSCEVEYVPIHFIPEERDMRVIIQFHPSQPAPIVLSPAIPDLTQHVSCEPPHMPWRPIDLRR